MSRSSLLRLAGFVGDPAPACARPERRHDRDHHADRFRGLDRKVRRAGAGRARRVVFIGYQRSQIDEAALRSWLPKTYVPLVRYPQFYGLSGRDLGLKFSFRIPFRLQEPALQRQLLRVPRAQGNSGGPHTLPAVLQ